MRNNIVFSKYRTSFLDCLFKILNIFTVSRDCMRIWFHWNRNIDLKIKVYVRFSANILNLLILLFTLMAFWGWKRSKDVCLFIKNNWINYFLNLEWFFMRLMTTALLVSIKKSWGRHLAKSCNAVKTSRKFHIFCHCESFSSLSNYFNCSISRIFHLIKIVFLTC